jgi:hypothetical protein
VRRSVELLHAVAPIDPTDYNPQVV